MPDQSKHDGSSENAKPHMFVSHVEETLDQEAAVFGVQYFIVAYDPTDAMAASICAIPFDKALFVIPQTLERMIQQHQKMLGEAIDKSFNGGESS